MAIAGLASLAGAASNRQILSWFGGPGTGSGFDYAGSGYQAIANPFLWTPGVSGAGKFPPVPANNHPVSALCDSSFVGALGPLVDAAPGKQLYLGKVWARVGMVDATTYYRKVMPPPLVIGIYDRLYHVWANYSGAGNNTDISISGPTVTRTFGDRLFYENLSLNNSSTLSVTYVNQSGGTSTASVLGTGANPAHEIPLAPGDTGVQSIISTKLNWAYLNSPSAIVVIAREIGRFVFKWNDRFRDALEGGLRPIDNGACLYPIYTGMGNVPWSQTPTGTMLMYSMGGKLEIYQQ